MTKKEIYLFKIVLYALLISIALVVSKMYLNDVKTNNTKNKDILWVELINKYNVVLEVKWK